MQNLTAPRASSTNAWFTGSHLVWQQNIRNRYTMFVYARRLEASESVSAFLRLRDKGNSSNYHPISLAAIVSIACKILESIILTQIRDYFESNKLMCPQQYCFVFQGSSLFNLLQYVELLVQYFNNRKPCDLILRTSQAPLMKYHVAYFRTS